MIADWAKNYLMPPIPFIEHGRDRDGADCWGLVCMVYSELFGLELPGYHEHYKSMRDIANRAAAFETYKTDDFVEVANPEPGDCVLLQHRGMPVHVGIYIGAEDGHRWMIHTTKQRGQTMRESIDGLKYKNAILGHYRHRARPQ